ncbi:MAG: NADH-ubiquinone oxidoreductase-F iron-sulfur binding region domain-containing protein [Acidimicrobiales bacterium]
MAAFLLPSAPLQRVEDYLSTPTGGRGLRRALAIGRAATIAEVTRAGLRGRGGGGFPTGQKWSSVASQTGSVRYLVCNGAEGEPGSFKDRGLLRANPYQLVEGLFIAAYALDAAGVYVALKAGFGQEVERLIWALQEMERAGLGLDVPVTIVEGPDEYLYGEEKALLEVIEGKSPLPRLLPPYEHGLFAADVRTGWEGGGSAVGGGGGGAGGANPTVVNNVETLSNVAHILAHGADWFRSHGTADSPGTVVATVVGDVNRPGLYEVELGTPLRALLNAAGGPRPGRAWKAVLSGVANPVLGAGDLDVALSYEAFAALGSGLGAAGFIVLDDTACMVDAARVCSQFLHVESCGQCPPCKQGSREITVRLRRLDAGEADPGVLGELAAWLERVTDGNRCYLAVEEQRLIGSILAVFADEVALHLETGGCPYPRRLTLPKLVELRDGAAVYDPTTAYKTPEWTYADQPVTLE